MTEAFVKAKELAEHVKDYVNTKIDSIKLTAAEKSSLVLSNFIAAIIIAAVLVFFVVFAGIAGAYALADWTGKTWLGFLIVAGIYLLIAVIVWVGRERFIRMPVMNGIISQLFSEEKEEDDEKN